MNTSFQYRGFPFFLNHHFNFFLRLLNHLLDSCRMDTSIHNQLLQRNSSYFPSDRIKRRKDHCLRRIIYDKIHTCQCLKRSDVTPFTSDNSSFHLIIGELYHGNRRLCHMVGSTSLNGCYHIFPGFLVRFLFGPALHILDHHGRFMFYVIFYNF